MIVIDVDSPWRTDELEVRLYECPSCEYQYVPFVRPGGTNWPSNGGRGAVFCPECGIPFKWFNKTDQEEESC